MRAALTRFAMLLYFMVKTSPNKLNHYHFEPLHVWQNTLIWGRLIGSIVSSNYVHWSLFVDPNHTWPTGSSAPFIVDLFLHWSNHLLIHHQPNSGSAMRTNQQKRSNAQKCRPLTTAVHHREISLWNGGDVHHLSGVSPGPSNTRYFVDTVG